MCACRVQCSTLSAPTSGSAGDVEDNYYPFLRDSLQSFNGTEMSSEVEDMYVQLAEKDRDLQLAAQLGKALLEQNEELKKHHEHALEDCNQKIEEVTQEKHALKFRLETVESEYESTVRELQNDIAQLREKLEEEQDQVRTGDKSRQQIIQELTQQNQRLTEELKRTSQNEEQLQSQVDELRQQVMSRRTSMHEHVQQLEILRDEINMLTERRSDLERRLAHLGVERDGLAGNLEEAHDRMLMLERHKHEQELQIQHQEQEISELMEQNSDLQDKVDSNSHSSHHSLNSTGNSLFSELEMSGMGETMTPDSLDNSAISRAQQGNQSLKGAALRPHTLPLLSMAYTGNLIEDQLQEDDDDDIECDDDIVMASTMVTPDSLDPTSAMARQYSKDEDEIEFRLEIMEVYSQLQNMVLELKGHRNPGSAANGHAVCAQSDNRLKTGSLLAVLKELRELMEDVVKRKKLKTSIACEDELELLERKVGSLKKELGHSQGHLDKLKADLHYKDQQLQKNGDELVQLTNKLTIMQLSLQQEEIRRLQLDRDRLQDGAAGITKDDIVDEARQQRDEATAQKNDLEMELARSRLDLMNLDSQLMNTIQQKLELSQQLEMWQDDMQDLIGSTLHRQLEDQRSRSQRSTPTTTPPQPRRKFHFPWS